MKYSIVDLEEQTTEKLKAISIDRPGHFSKYSRYVCSFDRVTDLALGLHWTRIKRFQLDYLLKNDRKMRVKMQPILSQPRTYVHGWWRYT